jgi:hypothetical protein
MSNHIKLSHNKQKPFTLFQHQKTIHKYHRNERKKIRPTIGWVLNFEWKDTEMVASVMEIPCFTRFVTCAVKSSNNPRSRSWKSDNWYMHTHQLRHKAQQLKKY